MAGALVIHRHGGHFLGLVLKSHPSPLAASSTGTAPSSATAPSTEAPRAAGSDPFPLPASYQTLIDRFFGDVHAASAASATDNVYGVSNEYGNSTRPTPGASHYSPTFGGDLSNLAGANRDTDPYPADGLHANSQGCDPAQTTAGPNDPPYVWCLTDAQIQSELNRLIAGLPTNNEAIYFVFLPPGVDECVSSGPETSGTSGNQCADTDFCAYHSSEHATSGPLYAVMPWADVKGCQSGNHPNGDPADDTLDVTSHEHIETITDPLGTSWITAQGNEIGDLCATPNVFGSPVGGTPGDAANPGSAYNQVIGADRYYLQDEFSDVNSNGAPMTQNCVQRPTTALSGDGLGENSTDPGPLVNPQGGPVLGPHTVYSIYWYPGGYSSAPTAAFTQSSTTARPGDAVRFDASGSTDPQGEPLTYSWDFGDGASGAGVSVSHAYSVPGDHTVTVTARDTDGYQSATTHTVHVFTPPAAAFTGPAGTSFAGQPLSFDASSSGGPEAPITTYAWSFGDGNTGSGVHVAHAYRAPGFYSVTLTITDAHGISASSAQQFAVGPAPLAQVASAGPPRVTSGKGGVAVLLGRRVICPFASSPCTATIRLTTPVTTRSGRKRRTRTYTIASARVTIAAGQSSVLSVALNAHGRSLLSRLHHLRVTAQINVGGGVLSPTATSLTFTISQPAKAGH